MADKRHLTAQLFLRLRCRANVQALSSTATDDAELRTRTVVYADGSTACGEQRLRMRVPAHRLDACPAHVGADNELERTSDARLDDGDTKTDVDNQGGTCEVGKVKRVNVVAGGQSQITD